MQDDDDYEDDDEDYGYDLHMLLGNIEILVQIVPGNKLAHPIQGQFLTLVAVGCPYIKWSQYLADCWDGGPLDDLCVYILISVSEHPAELSLWLGLALAWKRVEVRFPTFYVLQLDNLTWKKVAHPQFASIITRHVAPADK